MSIFQNQTALFQRLKTLFDAGEPPESAANMNYFVTAFGADPFYRRRLLEIIESVDERTRMIHELTGLHKQRIQEKLNPNQKVIAVYFPSCAYRDNVGDVARRLRGLGFNAITVIGTVCNDTYEQDAFVYYGGHDIVGSLDFVDLFVTPTPTFGLPPSATKVMFVHDIHDSPLGTVDDTYLRLLREFDYLYLPCAPVMKRFAALYQSESENNVTGDRSRKTALVPGGYIKLDRNIDYVRQHQRKTKTIIYAPTVVDVDGLTDIVSVPKYGRDIVDTVLGAFDEHTLIFRPHPHSLKSPDVQRIIDAFKEHPRFVLDDDPSFYMGNYAKAALLITDMSGTAYSYALSTLCPVLFFSPDEAIARSRYAGYQFFEDRNRVGTVVTDIAQLSFQISRLLAESALLEQRIRDYRDNLVFNVSTATDYFLDNIEFMLEHKPHPDWMVV